MRTDKFRAQSAMEYLMTYSWAILIIAVVLAVIFGIGLFNSTASLGNACIAQPGYSCTVPSITSDGLLTFTFGQTVSPTLYNVIFSCVSQNNSTPPTMLSYNAIEFNGVVQSATSMPSNFIAIGTAITVSGLPCYNQAGPIQPGSLPLGSVFTGFIWARVSSLPAGVNQYIRVAGLTIKSSS